MKKNEVRNFHIAAGAVFAFVATMNLSRLIFGWEVAVEGWIVPRFISVMVIAITLYLAHRAFKLA